MKKKKKHYREIDLSLRVNRMVREESALKELKDALSVWKMLRSGQDVFVYQDRKPVK